jgi:uncharacterized protein YdhG (YjbR/CyaY superfamily)
LPWRASSLNVWLVVSEKPTTVAEYIDGAREEAQEKLREIRAILKKVAPNAVEKLNWGTPVFEEERILFSYAAFKSHLTFMPTRSSLEPFQEELAEYETGKDTIQFRYDEPLPSPLIEAIAAYRVKEVTEEGALWKHH